MWAALTLAYQKVLAAEFGLIDSNLELNCIKSSDLVYQISWADRASPSRMKGEVSHYFMNIKFWTTEMVATSSSTSQNLPRRDCLFEENQEPPPSSKDQYCWLASRYKHTRTRESFNNLRFYFVQRLIRLGSSSHRILNQGIGQLSNNEIFRKSISFMLIYYSTV